MNYEVIVRNETEALKVELPKEVVDKLKQVSKYSEKDLPIDIWSLFFWQALSFGLV